jgi:hypothetical protein
MKNEVNLKLTSFFVMIYKLNEKTDATAAMAALPGGQIAPVVFVLMTSRTEKSRA